jgi:FkbM family methyltransferase
VYSDLVEIRDVDILGETNWYWIKHDKGCFGTTTDGPMRDWIDSHSTKYFEYVENFGTVVTGGTSCGMYARFYAKKFKHVYAFEPDPLSFHCMVNNCQSDNVYKLNAAIGPQNGVTGIVRASKDNVGANLLVRPNKFKIPILSIDSLNLDECDLIQLDVEGYEQKAIVGAQETIKKFRPVIIAERIGQANGPDLMEAFGYKKVSSSFLDDVYVHGSRINNS